MGQEADALLHKYRHLWEYTDWEPTDVSQPIPTCGGDTLLHYVAGHSGVDEVGMLVAAGADVNAPGEMGYTPLHHAAIWGQPDVAERLLALGADPASRNDFGNTAHEAAQQHGRAEMARMLRRAVKNHWPSRETQAGSE